MMCAIMNRFRRIKAAARHRPVFDSRMLVLLTPGRLIPALVRPGIIPAAFNSVLTQPLVTEFANLLQNALFATDQMRVRSQSREFPTIVYFRKIFLTFPI